MRSARSIMTPTATGAAEGVLLAQAGSFPSGAVARNSGRTQIRYHRRGAAQRPAVLFTDQLDHGPVHAGIVTGQNLADARTVRQLHRRALAEPILQPNDFTSDYQQAQSERHIQNCLNLGACTLMGALPTPGDETGHSVSLLFQGPGQAFQMTLERTDPLLAALTAINGAAALPTTARQYIVYDETTMERAELNDAQEAGAALHQTVTRSPSFFREI